MQVIYHCTVRTLAGVVVESTRSEYGGEVMDWLIYVLKFWRIFNCLHFYLIEWLNLTIRPQVNAFESSSHRIKVNVFVWLAGKGNPIRQVMGKSKMLLGLLEGLPTMLRGEVAMVLSFLIFHTALCTCVFSPCKHMIDERKKKKEKWEEKRITCTTRSKMKWASSINIWETIYLIV